MLVELKQLWSTSQSCNTFSLIEYLAQSCNMRHHTTMNTLVTKNHIV